MEPIIEILNAEQWKEYKEIRLKALKTNPEAFGSSYEEKVDNSSEEWQESLSDSGHKIYVANVKGKAVALASYSLEKPHNVKHLAKIHAVFVEPEFRKQGIGFKLIQKILDDLHINHITSVIHLSVNNEQEAAKNLYKKLGFREYGVARNEMRIGKKYTDQAQMELIFKDKL